MKDLISFLWRYRTRVALGILSLLVVDGGRLFIPQLIRKGVDDLTGGDTSFLLMLGLGILGIGFLVAVFRFFWRYLLIGVARRIRRDLRNTLYDQVLKFSTRFYQDHKTGDLMAHFTNDTNAVMRACGFGTIMFADFLFMTSVSIGAMIYINPMLTLYAFAPLPILTVFIYVFGNIVHRRFQRVQDTFSTLSDRVEEALAGIRIIKSSTREKEFETDYEEVNQQYLNRNLSLARYQGLFRPGIGFLSGVSMLIVLYYGGSLVVEEVISLGELVAFTFYLGLLTWPMMALGRMVNVVQRGTASMERINRLIHREPLITDEPDAVSLTGPGEIEFRNLTFSYDGENRALKRINLNIQPETSLGIIGRTGAGKSTLVHLLVRAFDPPKESIFIDGRDIRQYRLKSLRDEISLVPQDGFLFSSSVRDNISFGRPDATMDEIRDAARKAGIHEEIQRMPEGYDSLLGERGVSVSGGQKQRISIARAILTNPKILVLDDALSSVDAQKEEEVLANLTEVIAHRTAIIIAHRISAVRDLDHIITMDDGEITERGTHEELVENDGLYARINRLQKAKEEVERE